MKKLTAAVVATAVLLIVAYLVGSGQDRLKTNELAPAAQPLPDPKPQRRQAAPKPSMLAAPQLPSELAADAESIQVYLDAKQELLSQQLGLARVIDGDTPDITTAAQAQAELDRWSQENEVWRTWQSEAAAGMIENEARLKSAIGEQKFAQLQAWEAARHAEELK